MTGFDDPAAYGEAWAPVYDELFGGSGVSPAVDLLADLAHGGPALDMADVPVDGRFRLVYVVANSFFALLTQARQVDCFRAVAGALEPGGSFVLECFVPDPSRFDRQVQTLAVTEDSASYEIARHDPVNQRVHSQHVTVDEQGHRLRPVTLRYAWPAELDLMAQLAGLQPGQRYGDWDRGPFDATSTKHVSIYRLS
ncbi:hypothetical protein [Prauserella flavalba]|uniref:hypothetical protein n=1 Tax=Prauserella flavalba TaxID=1477506 RepID=UPI0036E8C769